MTDCTILNICSAKDTFDTNVAQQRKSVFVRTTHQGKISTDTYVENKQIKLRLSIVFYYLFGSLSAYRYVYIRFDMYVRIGGSN